MLICWNRVKRLTMWVNLDKPRMMSEFWKRRVDPYETQSGHSATMPLPMPMDDDYPALHTGRGSVLKSVLVWTAAALGVVVLLGAILVLPGLVF